MTVKPDYTKDTVKTFSYPVKNKVTSDDDTCPNHYYSGLKPVFLSMRLMGAFPYLVTDDKDVTNAPLFSRWAIYTYLMSLVQVSLAVVNIYVNVSWLLGQDMKLDTVLTTSLSVFHLGFLIYRPFCCYSETCRLTAYINDWRAVQEYYMKTIGSKIPRCMKYSPHIYLIASTISATLIMYLVVMRLFYLHTVADYFVYLFVFIHIDNRLLFWTYSNYYIWKTGKNIQTYVLKVIAEEKGLARSKKVAELRILWLFLSRQTCGLGWAVGMTTSAFTLISVVSLVIGMYAAVAWVLNSPTLAKAPLSIFLTAFEYMVLMFICEVTHRTTYAVGVGFMKRLLRIPKTSLDHDTNLEIHTFCLAINAQPPVITIAKYVTVDRTLWTKFLTTVITYMIFLGQVRTSEETA